MKTLATIITFALSLAPTIGGEIWKDSETGLTFELPEDWKQQETVQETNKATYSSPDENIYLAVSIVPLDTSIPDSESLDRMRNRVVETLGSSLIRDENFELNGLNGKLLEHKYSLQGLDVHSIQRFIIGHETGIVIEISGFGVDPREYSEVGILQDSIKFSTNSQIQAPKRNGTPEIIADITFVLLLVAIVAIVVRFSKRRRACDAANKAS
tara:strand:- start:810 stop:1445 length:636 start_codon:yes stop_codon:yes gene_type:complete